MCYWKTKRKIIDQHFSIADICKRDWLSMHILSFMKSDRPNCKLPSVTTAISCSCPPLDFSSFRLKVTLFLCCLSLNLTIPFSLLFMRWQAWRLSGVTFIPVNESAWHTLFSKSAEGIEWGMGLIFMDSLRTYWTVFSTLHSKLIARFSSREL